MEKTIILSDYFRVPETTENLLSKEDKKRIEIVKDILLQLETFSTEELLVIKNKAISLRRNHYFSNLFPNVSYAYDFVYKTNLALSIAEALRKISVEKNIVLTIPSIINLLSYMF